MFCKKAKRIRELEDKLQELIPKESQFNESLHYLLDGNASSANSSVTIYQALMYIQKIICNSIIYNDYAYTALRNPHTAPELSLVDFWPVTGNHNFNVNKLSNGPIYLSSNTTPFLTLPWKNTRIIDGLLSIGKDNNNPFQSNSFNISNVYLYPLGIVLVNNGNHSQLAGLLKNEMKNIKVNQIYDISKPLKESNDNHFSNFHGSQVLEEMSSIRDKWIMLMTIGKYLVDKPKLLKQFTEKIRNEI